MNEYRTVINVTDSLATTEGEGFAVHRPFPTRQVSHIDPFLLLDRMGPMDLAPGEAKGAPDHPHRGFETVTYILDGRMNHKDSQGNSGSIGPGDVQWMTAGAGVIHSEMPDPQLQLEGGRLHGFQLWVNLPARDKMMTPRYQEIPSGEIPRAASTDGKIHARIIAGDALGASAVIDTRTPIAYIHYSLEPDAELVHPLEAEFNAFIFIIEGTGSFGPAGTPAHENQIVRFENDGENIVARTGSERLDFLLIAGVPLGEPVARYGPFVMNTEREIHEAFADYRSGKLGSISA